MCLIGKDPNSYNFSRKALPGFLAYCMRDLVFLGSTFPAGTCCGYQEPLELWSLWVLRNMNFHVKFPIFLLCSRMALLPLCPDSL